MYQQVETDKKVNWNDRGCVAFPVATLADEHGGRQQITVDDHCFMLLNKRAQENFGDVEPVYVETSWWNREAIEVLKTLPTTLLD
jgi:hypothetical protein